MDLDLGGFLGDEEDNKEGEVATMICDGYTVTVYRYGDVGRMRYRAIVSNSDGLYQIVDDRAIIPSMAFFQAGVAIGKMQQSNLQNLS